MTSILFSVMFSIITIYGQQPPTQRIPVFNKHSIGKIIPDTKTTITPIQTEPDSLSSKRSIKPGYVIGFAAIGFLAGLFIGAETVQGEEISGAAFHIKPAVIGTAIGVGLGVAVSLLEPEKVKKKNNLFNNS